MANPTTAISVQIDANDKEQVTKILSRLGVTMSGLINMTIKQVILRGGIPFEVRDPRMSKEVEDALKELDYIESHLDEYKENNRWEDLRKELKAND